MILSPFRGYNHQGDTQMAQALVVTSGRNPYLDGRIAYNLILDWTAAAAGTVSLAVASTFTTAMAALGFANPPYANIVRGALRSIQTIPGANGDLTTTLPTDGYSITLLDKYSYDILAGVCSVSSGTVAEKRVVGGGKVIVDSELTLTISGAGADSTGRIILELEELATAHAD